MPRSAWLKPSLSSCDPLPVAESGRRSVAIVTTPVLEPDSPLSDEVRSGIADQLMTFLDGQDALVEAIAAWSPVPGQSAGGAEELTLIRRIAAEATSGGKRVRPACVLWGCAAVSGVDAITPAVWTAAASLDLLHVSALVHDDVMDGSDVRRGRPAAHKQIEAFHVEQGWSGDPAVFGRAGAILLGDLLVMWSAEMFDRAGLDPAARDRALPVLHAVRSEVTLGQVLDVAAQSRPPLDELSSDVLAAQRVVEHKSAKYTVLRPLLLGAQIAGGAPDVLAGLETYGSALGRAFQYRDDVLGVFGDEAVTGKPTGDDLREGKRTLLVAHTRARLSESDRARFDRLFGTADLSVAGRDELQALISGSGALAEVETMIDQLHHEAVVALSDIAITDAGRTALTALARAAVQRES